MTKQIECKTANQQNKQSIRVRVIKAPLVDTRVLRNIISQRARAVVI